MSKREIIDQICEFNRGTTPEFLSSFTEVELDKYLEHLLAVDLECLAACA